MLRYHGSGGHGNRRRRAADAVVGRSDAGHAAGDDGRAQRGRRRRRRRRRGQSIPLRHDQARPGNQRLTVGARNYSHFHSHAHSDRNVERHVIINKCIINKEACATSERVSKSERHLLSAGFEWTLMYCTPQSESSSCQTAWWIINWRLKAIHAKTQFMYTHTHVKKKKNTKQSTSVLHVWGFSHSEDMHRFHFRNVFCLFIQQHTGNLMHFFCILL